jgi:signal transduction histidine kinase
MLPSKTAILYTSLFIDDEGTRYSSGDALAVIAEEANRPIITDVDVLIGRGAAGGYVLDNVAYGKGVASLGLRILEGADVDKIPVTVGDFSKLAFDWRQLNRWNINESTLPRDSEIRFRPLTTWEQYRWYIVLASAVISLQTGLILALLFEHRRRRLAEVNANALMSEMAHMNRVATVGQLTASIAHEIRQPLSAIVASGEAGLAWLSQKVPNLEELRDTLQSIVSEGLRVADVVSNVRAMFKHEATTKELVNVNEVIKEIVTLVGQKLRTNRIMLDTNYVADPAPTVFSNSVQMRQLILNLVSNAIEAMSTSEHQLRVLNLKTAFDPTGAVLITIADTGPGIDPKVGEGVFQRFVTTKSAGMGVGLSICKSIVEEHGGRLTITPAKRHGTVVNVVLPYSTEETKAVAAE